MSLTPEQFQAILRNMPQLARRAIRPALFAAGQKIAVEAQISITDGAVSGANHAPSAPGAAPNNDTGVLANNIETAETGDLKVEVSSNAPYSAALEFGTSKIAARPFMAPAAQKKTQEANDLVRRALEAEIRRRLREAGRGNR